MMQVLPSRRHLYKVTLYPAPISKLVHAPTFWLVHLADITGFILK
jgi:hypothetical protein